MQDANAPRTLLLSIIPVAAATRHLGAIFWTFAVSRARRRRRVFGVSPLLREFSPFPHFPSHPCFTAHDPAVANKNSANALGAVKYVRDARLDAGDPSVRKYRDRVIFLLLYLENISVKHRETRNLAGRTKHTARHSAHFQFSDCVASLPFPRYCWSFLLRM